MVWSNFVNFIKKAFTNDDVRNRILFTLAMILVIRFLDHIVVPGLTPGTVISFFSNNNAAALAQTVSGGSSTGSILTLGLGSYISASIIIQLLQSVIKRLDDLSKEGQRGRMVINQITRYLTLPITLLQATLIWFTVFMSQAGLVINADSTMGHLIGILSITAGTMLLMWIAEEITQRGIGQGSTIVIILGILSRIPSTIGLDITGISASPDGIISVILMAVFIGLFLVLSVIISEAVRKVIIQYASRVRGEENSVVVAPKSFFPIKVNMAGVMPVIFASMILNVPNLVSDYVLRNIQDTERKLYKVSLFLNDYIYNTSNWTTLINRSSIEIILILGFTVFTTFLYFKPKEIAENLQKSGAFVPGYKPGAKTETYLGAIMLRLSIVGALLVAFVVITPIFLVYLYPDTMKTLNVISGTSIMILVSGFLEIYRQVNSYVVSRSYDKYRI